MSLIERNCRFRTFRCKTCNTLFIINPNSERYHREKKCKKMLKA